MGHRAYVAYEQANGTFNVHFSHWGAHDLELCSRIDENHPLGGPNDLEPAFLMELTQMLIEEAEENDLEVAGAATAKQNDKCVRPNPEATNLSMREVVEMATDRGIETLYVVEQDFTTHGYVNEHLELGSEYVGNFLFAPEFEDGKPKNLGYMKGYVRGVKNQLQNLVENDVLSIDDAHNEFLTTALDKFGRGSADTHALAHSTAMTENAIQANRTAFMQAPSQTRVFGVMLPRRYKSMEPWKVPDGMEIPPAYEEFSEHINALVEEQPTQDQHTLGSFDKSTADPVLDRPSESELPETALPTDPDKDGILIDGKLYRTHDFPDELRTRYTDYINAVQGLGIGYTKVHECEACRDRDDDYEHGYLTTSSNVDDYKNPYSCPRSWQEEHVQAHALTGRYSPETWDVALTVNGDTTRVIGENSADEREYELIVRCMEEYEYKGDIREETRMTLTPPSDGSENASDPTETVTGETAGCAWKATITYSNETAFVDWKRVTEDGDPVKYAYREESADGQGDPEPLGFLPVSDVDTDTDDITVEALESTVKSTVYSRDCESTTFEQVWPPSEYLSKTVNVHAVDGNDLPNTKQHLTKMRGEVKKLSDADELLDFAAVAAHHIWDVYGHPSEIGRDGICSPSSGETPEPSVTAD